METLRAALASTESGSGTTLLLSGAAGVGKSRLLREVGYIAAVRGFLVLQGGCFETEQSLPFSPVIDLLRGLLLSVPAQPVRTVLDRFSADLARLVPEMEADTPTRHGVTGSSPALSLGPEGDKHRLISSLAALLTELASLQPLLICLEDLHWSDDISLEFFLHIARRASQQPILLLGTYRDDERQPALLHTLSELDRRRLALEMQLRPLSPEEVDAMLRSTFGLHRPVQFDFLNRLHDLTEGNPFFVEEVLKSLLSSGEIVYGDILRDHNSLANAHVPRTVQDTVQRRWHKLSPEAREMLALAAVLGKRFSFNLLLDLLEADEAGLLSLIKECIQAQLIVEESAEHFAFRHALTREAIYSGLLARERKALHHRVGLKLEQGYLHEGGISQGELAYHCYEAGMWEQARDHARQAGEEAQALYAHSAAVSYFTMALNAIEQLGAVPVCGLYSARGFSHSITGNFEAALADHTRALQLARSSRGAGGRREEGDASSMRDEWQSLLDLAALWSIKDYRETERYCGWALDLARLIGDPSTLAHTLNRVGNLLMNMYMPDEARGHHEEALAIFEQLDEQPGIAETLGLLGYTYLFSADLRNAASFFRKAISLCRQLGNRLDMAYNLGGLALCSPSFATDTGVPADISIQEAISGVEEAVQIAHGAGWRSGEAFMHVILADCYITLGDYDAALQAAQMCLDEARDIDQQEWIATAHYCLGRTYADMLAMPQAIEHLTEASSLARTIGSVHWISVAGAELAFAAVRAKDLVGAEQILRDILSEGTPPRAIGHRICWVAKAELGMAQLRPDVALDIADRLLGSAPGYSEANIGIPRLLKLRGDALARLGESEAAEAALLEGISAARAQGLTPLLWTLHVSLGNLYRGQGNRNAAGSSYAGARGLTQELARNISDGALRDGFLKGIDAMLPHVRAASPARLTKAAFGGLTAREREVAALVSRGYTNRRIGEELSITEETAAVHVRNILSKLDFTSRTQIATWAAEHSL